MKLQSDSSMCNKFSAFFHTKISLPPSCAKSFERDIGWGEKLKMSKILKRRSCSSLINKWPEAFFDSRSFLGFFSFAPDTCIEILRVGGDGARRRRPRRLPSSFSFSSLFFSRFVENSKREILAGKVRLENYFFEWKFEGVFNRRFNSD